MSEHQKIFTSLSGAFVAHLLLLVLIFVLLSTRTVGSALRKGQEPPESRPREVTILLSELPEKIEVASPMPEARPFISTDLNRPEENAPEDPRFESDRNTTAASELPSDPEKSGENVPTLDGDNPLPHLTLQNRDYREGELNELPAERGSSQEPLTVARPSREPVEETTDLEKEAKSELPPATEEATGERDTERAREKSLVDRLSGLEAPAIDGPPEQRERVAGAFADTDAPEQPVDRPQEEVKMSADEGLFAEGFTPEERTSVIKGAPLRSGQNAVDAEGTAMGIYKKAVRDVISATWHRYRQDNADFVTWGILKMEFAVEPDGGVKNLHIIKNEANAMLAEFSLKAIRDAKLPPMPSDVAASVGSEGLVIQYDIIIY